MIRLEHVTKSYKNSTVALRDVSINVDKGEFVFLVGPSGFGQVDVPAAAHQGGGARQRADLRGRQGHRRAEPVEGAVPAPQHRLRLPGLPSAAEQDRARERGVRARGHRATEARHRLAGAADPRTRRAAGQSGEPAERTLRWRAAARRHRPRLRQPAADPVGRRADRQPRPQHDRSASCACSTASTAPARRC